MSKEPKDIKAIFSEALEKQTAEERAAYLDEACGNDADLRSKVEALLKAHSEAGDFLEVPALGPDVNADESPSIEGPKTDIIALDEALTKLTKEDKIVAELVKLRYFAGLTLGQAANILGVSQRTADRYWAYARAWLYQEITKAEKPPCR